MSICSCNLGVYYAAAANLNFYQVHDRVASRIELL